MVEPSRKRSTDGRDMMQAGAMVEMACDMQTASGASVGQASRTVPFAVPRAGQATGSDAQERQTAVTAAIKWNSRRENTGNVFTFFFFPCLIHSIFNHNTSLFNIQSEPELLRGSVLSSHRKLHSLERKKQKNQKSKYICSF